MHFVRLEKLPSIPSLLRAQLERADVGFEPSLLDTKAYVLSSYGRKNEYFFFHLLPAPFTKRRSPTP